MRFSVIGRGYKLVWVIYRQQHILGISVTYGSTYGTLPTVTLTGYTFSGWYTAATGGTKVTSATTVTLTAAQTLYAQWTTNSIGKTTNTTLRSSDSTSDPGRSVTFTATVRPATGYGMPTGTVQFMDGANALGAAVTLNRSGVASFTTSTLASGSHSITAFYSGDSNFATSTSAALTQTVKFNTNISLTSPLNPSTFGASITFTAQVKVTSSTATPTGKVTFKDGTKTLSTVPLVNGSASYTIATLTAGSHSITVTYTPTGIFESSSSSALMQTVSQASTSTSLVSSSTQNTSVSGKSVKFTATVSSSVGTPTGTVTFYDGTKVLGTVSLSGGSASFSISSLAVGAHNIKATFNGGGSYAGSPSTILTQTVVAKPVIAPTSLPSGRRNTSYSQTLSVTGGLGPYTWSISAGSLPSGLKLNAPNPSNVVITGTLPNTTGTFTFTVKVTDSLGDIATQTLSIRITN